MNQAVKHFYEFGAFRLDATEHLLLRDGHHVPMTPKAFETLLVLVENGGHVLEKDELIKKVWPNTFVEEVNLAKNVSSLRKILGGEQSEQYIETIPKRGYRFVAGVKEVWEENGSLIASEVRTSPSGPEGINGKQPGHVLVGLEPGSGFVSEPSTAALNGAATEPLTPARHSRWPLAILALGLTLGLGAWAIVWRPSAKAPPNPLKIAPLTSFPGSEDQLAFSPDGDQVAFVWNGEKEGNTDIYVKLIGAETPLRLTSNPLPDTDPAWSPDGRSIAFLRHSAKSGGVFIVSALGGPERKVADSFPYRPVITGNTLSYSPDGRSLVFPDKSSQSEAFSIFSLAVNTGEKSKLTSPPPGAVGDLYPSFSPDQKLLAFVRSDSIAAADIYLIPASGGPLQRVTFDNTSIRGLTWTTDGREIIFASRRGGSTYNLWKVPIAGGTPEQLMTNERDAFSPTISRNANRLAYTLSSVDGNVWRLPVPASKGQSNAPMSQISSSLEENGPNYSNDGRKIVFASRRSGSFEIWVCESDGSNPRQLTSIGGPLTGTPRFAPDGKQIAFDSWFEGNAEIYVISVEGGAPRRLTFDPAEDITPSWSRDSQWVYFGSTRGGGMQIWKVPVAGGPPVQVTKQGGFEGFESPDGRFFYYAKGRAMPGIWSVPVGGGEETLVLDHHQAGLWRYWATTEKGIYFATAEMPSRPTIEFFSFASKKVTQIAQLDKPLFRTDPGLAVAPDGQSILVVQMDQSGSDIMLVENFR